MKTVKGLLLGSAAAFVAMSGAQAADLPMAEPVQYVKVCDTYGAGFFYIPGTQTCLQISGQARAQLRWDEPDSRADNAVSFRAYGVVNFDARSQTPWGTLRAYVGLQAYWQNANGNPINYMFWGSPVGNPNFPPASAGNSVFASAAYVQFAGITAGYAPSFYTFAFGIPEMFHNPFVNLSTSLLVGYTANFGNGFSASLSVEDRHYREANFAGSAWLPPAGGAAITYAGQQMPDIVGNIRVVQPWGAAQLSGVVHQIRLSNGLAAGAPIRTWDTDYGFAVQAGVSFNLPALGAGDKIALTASYANGALAFISFGPSMTLGPYGPLGAGYSDGWLDAAGNIHRSSGWQVVGTLKHYWTPTLRSNFTVAYTSIDQPAQATLGLGPAFRSLSDVDFLSAGVNLIWSPVKDLDLGLEVFNQTAFQNSSQKAVRGAARNGFDDSRWTIISQITRRF